ncbi:ATP synthase F1 subunit epsilon [Membranihabitans marinus]|uniref:ATP synthase F1 subunit epsilon n=1 Tax=Membranihabitans marinus TaxID=1227546 RepID=UPI001EFF722D|nr:ATP synthase F1 subunit epsilon [Membranihabitans marinus]
MVIEVLTPEEKLFTGEITSVMVPGISGRFQILENHAPIVSALVKGDVELTLGTGEKQNFSIEKGFIEVLNNEVSLLVYTAAAAE